ncbi:hypothetical protein MWH03_00580 [Klebsiella pneumoniae]|nr:hypothetical protein [Klebsiella pneumoniae]
MPQKLLNPADVQKTFAMLTVDAKNRQLLTSLAPWDEVQEIGYLSLPPGYELVRVDNRLQGEGILQEHFELALINTVSDEIVYYNRVIVQPDAYLNYMPVTQILIWRSPKPSHRPALRDLPGKIFSSYLLEKYNVIITDRHQTNDGMNFWQTRLYEALASNRYIYGYDMITCELRHVSDEASLGSSLEWLWGDEEHHQDRLAIISVLPLPRNIVEN